MSTTVVVAVDGEHGKILALNPGIRVVKENVEVALTRVSKFQVGPGVLLAFAMIGSNKPPQYCQ